MSGAEFETRYEWLRPGQLRQRQEECSLAILPVGPLEYHGPALPLGTDAINAGRVAHACCARLKKGVVLPTVHAGTERERCASELESLGFGPNEYVVGMDFPTRLWNSHYHPEEIFALIVATELKMLVAQGYQAIFIVNGHGATNHNQALRRLCVQFSNTTPARVDFALALAAEVLESGAAGHADVVETSILMHYRPDSVDLGTLPPRDVPLKYKDFSIVDGAGFTPQYDPRRVVQYDPREATAERGRELYEQAVSEITAKIERLLRS